MFLDAPTATPLISGGKIRPLGISGTMRMPSAPNVPTIADAGVSGFDVS